VWWWISGAIALLGLLVLVVAMSLVFGRMKRLRRVQRSLMVRLVSGGLFRGRLGISSSLLDLQGRTIEGLVLELQAAQSGQAVPPAAPEWSNPRAAAPRAAVPAAAPAASRFGTEPARTFGRRGA